MPTNIGNLNFGIDANTKGLQRAIAQLSRFKSLVNRTAKDGADGAQKLAAAYGRQESAIKRAFQQTLKLQQAQKRAGAPAEQVARTSNAFRRLTQEMTSGNLTTVEFARSMDSFTAKLGRGRRALTDMQNAASGKKIGKLTDRLRNLESASVLAVGPLSGLGARIRSLGAIAGRSSLKLVGLFAGVTAAIVGFVKLSSAAINAGKVFESSMARFEAASGSIEIARKQMAFVIKTSEKLGLRIDTSAKAFSRLTAATKGTSIEGEGTRKIFLAVSKAAAALRLGAGEVEGTFRAIEQIMSKGSVQAEELRGQLGERLPGAFRIAAESMGVTTAALGQMLKAGEVLADDFLPKFADALEKAFGDKALDNVNSFQGSMNGLANEALLFSQAFNKASNISNIFIGAIQKLAGAIRALRMNLNGIIAALAGVVAGMLVLAGPVILGGFIKLSKAIRGAAVAMLGFNVLLAANPLAALGGSLIKVAIAGTAAIAVFFGLKRSMDAATDAITDVDPSLNDLIGTTPDIDTLGQAFKTLSTSIEGAVAETRALAEALSFMDRFGADDLENLIKRFTLLGKVQALSAEEVEALGKSFTELNKKFPLKGFLDELTGTALDDVEKVAEAYFRFQIAVENAQAAVNKVTFTNTALQEGTEQIATMLIRLQELKKGQVAADLFDDITVAVMAFNATFKDTTISLKDRVKLEAMFEAALIATLRAEKDLDKAEKDRKRNLSETATAQKKFITQLVRSTNAIDVLRVRIRELAKGPDSFEVFTKVTEKVIKFRQELERAFKGIPDTQALVIALTGQYQMLLEEQLLLTNRLARAGDKMASVVIDGFEKMITKGGDVKEMLKEVARELLRVWLRAQVLDQLQAGLSTIFGNFLNTGTNTSTPAVSSTTTPRPIGPKFARGGSFRLPGAGGSDKVPFFGFGKPGETVSVTRPDQRSGGASGGGGITINQYNTFENSTPDPEVLIPILEANNRRLMGEILDGFDRGTFA